MPPFTGILSDIQINGVSLLKPAPPPVVIRGLACPAGFEFTGEYRKVKPDEWALTQQGKAFQYRNSPGFDTFDMFFILRKSWVWPAWLKAPYIAMDDAGDWYAYPSKPVIYQGIASVWSNQHPQVSAEALTRGKLFDFTPPPCSYWRESLRKNPNA